MSTARYRKSPSSRCSEAGGQGVRLVAEQDKPTISQASVKNDDEPWAQSVQLVRDGGRALSAENPKLVALDCETYFDEDHSVTKLGPKKYAEAPLFNCYLVAIVSECGEQYAGTPEQAPWHLLHGADVVTHNNSFDNAVYERLCAVGVIPDGNQPRSWIDSASIAVYHRAPRKLKVAAKALLGEEIDKGYRTVAKGRKWGDFTHAEKDMLRDSCLADAKCSLGIAQQYGPEWPDVERELSQLHLVHNQRGIQVNELALEKGIEVLSNEIRTLEQQMPWVSAGATPLSKKAMVAYLTENGISIPASFSKKNPEYLAWETKHATAFPAIKAVRGWREANGLLKRLESMRKRIRRDGRISVELLYHGAATGRAAGAGLNLHSLPNGERHGVNIRSMITPSDGCVFVAADLAQIEPRCVATVMKKSRMLEQLRNGLSPYEAYARSCLGWQGGKLKVEDPRLYALGKVCVLSLAYGTGARRFREKAAAEGVILSAQEAQQAVDDFRRVNADIVGQWRALEKKFKAHAGRKDPFKIPLPSGRSLFYFDVSYCAKDQAYVARTERGGAVRKLWGSKLFENAIQAVARDVFMEMMTCAEREGLRTLLHVHDELLVECPLDDAERVCEQLNRIMSTPPEWLPDLPLAAETKTLTYFE